MDLNSKLKADAKVDELRKNVGFPRWIFNDKLLNQYYASIINNIANNNDTRWFTVMSAVDGFLVDNYWAKLKAPVRPTQLLGPLTTINAFYSDLNLLIISIGIMQSPYFK